jgi:valyl-tRNA synthetase
MKSLRPDRADRVPFRALYLHALVRDPEGMKMSKTRGNVVDPLAVIEEHGTDALRFTLAIMAAPGTDIALSEERIAGYRAFANKIWNAARFIFMNMDRIGQSAAPEAASTPGEALEDRWILSRLHRTIRELDEALETCRFDEAAHRVYTFFWGDFCDWYIELSKLRLGSADQQVARATIAFVTGIFDQALRLLSPFMPFITEELWHALYEAKPPRKSIAIAEFPQHDDALISDRVEEEMAILQDLIVSIRQIRHDLGVEPKASVPVRLFSGNGIRELIEGNQEAVQKLANVASMQFVGEELAHVPGARHTARFDVVVEYEKKVDKAAESARLQKELVKLEGEMANAQRQLSNEQFLAKAPAHVVGGIRRRLGELEILITKTRAALKALE